MKQSQLDARHHFCWDMQGYYRRADASLGMGKMKKALSDFKRAASVAPRDPDLRKKLLQCEREVKRIRFEEALAAPVSCDCNIWSLLCMSAGNA